MGIEPNEHQMARFQGKYRLCIEEIGDLQQNLQWLGGARIWRGCLTVWKNILKIPKITGKWTAESYLWSHLSA